MLAARWPLCLLGAAAPLCEAGFFFLVFLFFLKGGDVSGGKLDGFLKKKGKKETISASIFQVSLFCANVAFPCYSGSACSSLRAGFLQCACTALGTTES